MLSNYKKGDIVHCQQLYELDKCVVLSVGKKNLKVKNPWGNELYIAPEKCCLPDEKVLVVWEQWKGVNGRGSYRLEKELYPEYRIEAKNYPHQGYIWENKYGILNEDLLGNIKMSYELHNRFKIPQREFPEFFIYTYDTLKPLGRDKILKLHSVLSKVEIVDDLSKEYQVELTKNSNIDDIISKLETDKPKIELTKKDMKNLFKNGKNVAKEKFPSWVEDDIKIKKIIKIFEEINISDRNGNFKLDFNVENSKHIDNVLNELESLQKKSNGTITLTQEEVKKVFEVK